MTKIQFTNKTGSYAVRVEDVSKKYSRSLKRSLWYGAKDIVRESLAMSPNNGQLRASEFWAVKNANFNVKRGECIGIVGANGSGKTTLLRIISGLLKPSVGCVEINGKVAPLLALGAGFNPVLSGRENVFANMSVLGVGRNDIKLRFDEVIEFSEIGYAIDAPVQTYSSGMRSRLGFACAINTRPEILIVDEVLSVGDMAFRSKCYRKLAELRENGTSILLVTHNANAILTMCDQAVYLSKGIQKMLGNPVEVMNRYEKDLYEKSLNKNDISKEEDGEVLGEWISKREGICHSGFKIKRISVHNNSDDQVRELQTGTPGIIRLEGWADRAMTSGFLGIIIREISGEKEVVLNLSAERDGQFFDFVEGPMTLELRMPIVGLRPGMYSAKIYVSKPPLDILDAVESFKFSVNSSLNLTQCRYFQIREWVTVCQQKRTPVQVVSREIEK